ncbi:unnamed protein product [Protopolystoma xenopodis]|uniref:Uncharacterized protein n=1 Tax=Protopolystoma xenopodis TaxID=117903 RepID=A0A3S5CDR0_9PLAT|nr:unnamed protein product [Protopolystoma xenopodis]
MALNVLSADNPQPDQRVNSSNLRSDNSARKNPGNESLVGTAGRAAVQASSPLIDLLSVDGVDLAAGYQMTVSRGHASASLLTKPYLTTSIGLLISRREYQASGFTSLTTFLAPFDWTMWLAIFFTIQVPSK